MNRRCRFHFVLFLLLSCVAAYSGDNRWTSGGPYASNVTDLIFRPSDGKVVFATSSGETHRSTNEGKSWEGVGRFLVIRFNPLDPEIVIAADTSIYQSTDRGETWQVVSSNPLGGEGFQDIEFHPKNPKVLYALDLIWGGATQRRVLKSTDGGVTWAQKLAKPWDHYEYDLAVDPTNGDVVYVSLGGKVYKSTDGGESWRPSCAGMGFGKNNRLIVDPTNPSTVYAAGSPVYKSTDGGGRWSRLLGAGGSYICVDPSSTQTLYVSGASGVFKSTDGGGEWSRLDVDPEENDMGPVAVHPSKSNLVLAGSPGQGIFRSNNSGRGWQPASVGLDGMDAQCLLYRAVGKGSFMALGASQIHESLNRGKSWRQVTFGVASSLAWWAEVHPQNPDLIAAAGYFDERRYAVAISTNGGNTWSFCYAQTGSQAGTLVAWDPTDQRTLYLSALDFSVSPSAPLGIAKSTDRGQTWRLVNRGLSEKYVTRLVFDPWIKSRMYAGTMSGGFFTSDDGGEHWHKRSSIEGSQFRAIVPHPSLRDVLFAATYPGGLYSSTNAGKSWVFMGVPNCAAVAFLPSSPHTLLAGGGGELVVSTDDGETWSNFDSNGLGRVIVRTIMVDPEDDQRFFIGTDRGVFSYTQKGSPGGPVIQQLSPSYGRAGDVVSINGRSFGQVQGTSRVTFAGVDTGLAQTWSDTSITAVVPNGVRTGPVTVTVANKKSNAFEFIALPAAGSVEPTSGPPSGGTKVTIIAPSGTSSTQFNVLFGSTVANEVRMIAPDIILCTSPPGTGTVEVKVTSSVTSTTVGTFTYGSGAPMQVTGRSGLPMEAGSIYCRSN